MAHAFPEDELKPISCEPQTRNRENPADIGLNDVLGNYSVTLIDSLSTLAILASDPEEQHARHALREFQAGVTALVELYGDGSEGKRCGSRACGFDLDSKVQVFETNIRGVGGLLSAHLFAVGDLPIRGYNPVWGGHGRTNVAIIWDGRFKYDGQLLRLAHDLASRLLPAFSTVTGLPYPRVNLKHGIPFHRDAEAGVCRIDGTSSDPREVTETCSAGAGSLVLEFTTLSRLSNDTRFEDLAKRAFWAVWERRSGVGLIGGGLDAESGQWTMPPLAGIGAGIDSFFEYALKASILLSGLSPPPTTTLTNPGMHDPQSYLQVWQASHSAIRHHIYRSSSTEKHPYYAQSDLLTGAPRYTWIDNLSAYYPGLLTLAGHLAEAIESHLLFSALWTRYSALPERWQPVGNMHTAGQPYIDPNFKHWAGRPEFVESNWYLFRATGDPWFLHVGEMFLRDVKRRCWTKCGWATLGDVVSGEQRDRMESFFLGETAKYLYLLFDENHPLNKGDRPIVFSTEGHPLVIPDRLRTHSRSRSNSAYGPPKESRFDAEDAPTCPAAPSPLPLTISHVANSPDLFHAAALAQLHLVPINPTRSSPLLEASGSSPGISLADIQSPSNYTFYPWTLPPSLIPPKGTSSPIQVPITSTLTFPNLNPPTADGDKRGPQIIPLGALQKVVEGVLINSLSNVRLSMVQQSKSLGMAGVPEFRIQSIANWALGRDEKVLVSREAVAAVSPADPHFTRVKDLEMVDLVVDAFGIAEEPSDGQDDDEPNVFAEWDIELPENATMDSSWSELQAMVSSLLSSALAGTPDHPTLTPVDKKRSATLNRHIIPAILPTGAGAAQLPAPLDPTTADDPAHLPLGYLPTSSIFFLDSTLCPPHRLPASIARTHNILVLKRGGCSFAEKLSAIPSFPPGPEALQLVIVLSVPESRSPGEKHMSASGELIRPLLDEVQRTPNGIERREPLAMVMVDGGEETVGWLRGAARSFGFFDEGGKLAEVKQGGLSAGVGDGEGEDGRAGLAVKRRYWFESMGVPIGNLIML
ncbi:hypothetical protein LTR91_018634 [Friedmanniomyces endolithicus]|uniref:alpha-1,2-Mannosidase n=1 Tax=Friedmanniomyces endolithicus TaxID=329885 RepID=A0AAN6JB19_9PEZI|nr:hypothetical protein LTR35_011554 [Friedmanniomyces endolithicus]KAK0288340.1 hypothetical protein LTS00_009550 [Friedmanniomyces endolithicus]KAK0317936.1 hypothetical protein LTR82_011197 [Friedmanniomyces endolithicus]KAK0921398.1 hypothetical protein LTR57_008854 [Friedmanniomyces endolithicus]KAK0958917.1 hypothetical protein LTS01_021630 [Friedmanniomyces endolithicus]